MQVLNISIGEPFSSPAWGSNFMVFSSPTGAPIPESELKEYLRKACHYAKKNGIYLVPERFIMMDYHCLCLIDPEGNVMGAQQALFHSPENSYLKKGKELSLIPTEFGSVVLCVDIDIYYPEVAKIAKNMGGDYIISSQYVPAEDYTSHSVVAGVWNASQSNHIFTVGVSNVFQCICAPRIVKQYSHGFIVQPTSKLPVVAGMKADLLAQLPAKPALSRTVYVMHERELFPESAEQ